MAPSWRGADAASPRRSGLVDLETGRRSGVVDAISQRCPIDKPPVVTQTVRP